LNSTIDYPSGSAIIQEIKRAGVQYVASVPDIVTSDGLLWPLTKDTDLKLVRVCKEDEGISICAAMSYNNTRALMLMQQTGLFDSLNAVRALGMDYELPICMMVGLQGKEPNLPAHQSKSYGVRIVAPVLDAMGVSQSTIDGPDDIDQIAMHINHAYEQSAPHCFLIGRPPVYP
jgi:sulfopyruvate decarboxylase subunit alpha